MLTELTVEHFVIVERMTLEFGAGLTAFTGETGAGKSILIDAVALLTGARLETDCVMPGAAQARLAARFDTTPGARAFLETAGFEPGEETILARTIDASGRSKISVDGMPATAAFARELAQHLVDIHGQSEHQQLLKPANQTAIVDAHAGNAAELEAAKNAYLAWREAGWRLREAREEKASVEDKLERLTYLLSVMQPAAPAPGRWEEINAAHRRLANAHEIEENLAVSQGLLDDASVKLSQSAKLLEKTAAYDEAFAPMAESLGQALEAVSEVAREVARSRRGEADAESFEAVDAELSAYFQAARAAHVEPERLHEKFEDTKLEISRLSASLDTEALEAAERAAFAAYGQAASRLRAARGEACARLGGEVTSLMQSLAMAGGRFQARLIDTEPSAAGTERVEFFVAAHAGAEPAPLSKTASGGELSRIALALFAVAARTMPVPTLVFDEVDAGIGGATAFVVGRLLKELSAFSQVLVITHLPQVASFAAEHFLVAKSTSEGRTTSRVERLDAAARVEELARMLAGLEVGEAARENAIEMLAAAQGRAS